MIPYASAAGNPAENLVSGACFGKATSATQRVVSATGWMAGNERSGQATLGFGPMPSTPRELSLWRDSAEIRSVPGEGALLPAAKPESEQDYAPYRRGRKAHVCRAQRSGGDRPHIAGQARQDDQQAYGRQAGCKGEQ